MRNVVGHENTAEFIKIVVNWWKTLNVTSTSVDVTFKNKFNPYDEGFNANLQFDESTL